MRPAVRLIPQSPFARLMGSEAVREQDYFVDRVSIRATHQSINRRSGHFTPGLQRSIPEQEPIEPWTQQQLAQCGRY